jgi:hypothetical protein
MSQPDPAQNRWMVLNLLRVTGVILMVVGAIVWKQGMAGFQDETIGKLILSAGLFEALVIPAMLRRKWRSTDDGER